MHRLRHKSLSLALTCIALLALVGLAVLQYIWVGQVSESARARMQASASAAAARFTEEFDRELARAYLSLQMDALTLRDRNWTVYERRYANWRTHAPYPQMVESIYLATVARNGRLTLARFDPSATMFEPVAEWPAEFQHLHAQLDDAYRTRRVDGDLIVVDSPNPVADPIPALVIPVARPWLLTSSTDESDLIDADFVIGRSIFTRSRRNCQNCAANSPLFAYTIVTLSRPYLTDTFIPLLIRRHLGAEGMSTYHLEIVSHSIDDQIVYTSGYGAPERSVASAAAAGGRLEPADATAELFTLRMDEFNRLVFDGQGNGVPDEAGQRPLRIAIGMMQAPENSTGVTERPTSGWQLRLSHQAGSLETVVESLRVRNLAISFGTLLMLGFALVMIAVSTRRAQRLARQQVEFVAAISHELRTPLSVICSAGENLADGVVHDVVRSRQYGALIHREGRRLTEMVEQVLEFAGTQADRSYTRRRMIDPCELVEQALVAYRPHIENLGIELHYSAAQHVPMLNADVTALQRAIHNLVSNAVKYSGAGRNIHVSVGIANTRRSEVVITVRDEGPGIASADLPHIFEPFYRGAAALETQIHGSGLGLSLVRLAVEAHGGRVTVQSVLGQGTTFTLHMPTPALENEYEAAASTLANIPYSD
jgi:signal transduction histidine kinase